jgi:hypothetical protein
MPRKPTYLSPSALDCFETDAVEYYRRYLAENRPPKFPQTMPMAAGSAFDAYVKSHLHDVIFGKGHKDSARYELRALFEAQVESHLRNWAWPVGHYIFEEYKASGALADLMIELQGAIDDPKFEFDLTGEVKGSREPVEGVIQGVTIMGKPDLHFINGEGAHVVYDWKVNGFCGKANTSPKPGYVMLRDSKYGNWQRLGAHKNAFLQRYRGIEINTAMYLEQVDPKWATQLAAYGWLLGEPVGSEVINGIDQIACRGDMQNEAGFPKLRIASHRLRVSENFQYRALDRFQYLWSLLSDIGTDKFYFFRDVSFEESKIKCESIEAETVALTDPDVPSEIKWGYEIARGQW